MSLSEPEAYEAGRTDAPGYYTWLLRDATERAAREPRLKKVVKAADMGWELGPQGRMKHLLNETMGARAYSVDLFIQEIPAGSRSGRHRHTAEEFIYVLEGRGYDLHWDADVDLTPQGYVWRWAEEPARYDWEAGDVLYVPVKTIHQHFNAEPGRRARFISGINRVYRHLGFNDLEQLENAPEYDGRG